MYGSGRTGGQAAAGITGSLVEVVVVGREGGVTVVVVIAGGRAVVVVVVPGRGFVEFLGALV